MQVCVIGLGYIGFPTAVMLSSHGVEVIGVDYNAEIVASLDRGEIPFEEKGIDEVFRKAVANGISFTTKYPSCGVYIIAVPTPYNPKDKKIDARYVVGAIEAVTEVCPKGAVIVIESTVSPGTTDRSVRPLLERKGLTCGEDIHLAHAPERIIPGNMIYELEYNNRTIGADSREVGERVREIYRSFCQGEIVVTDIRTAEMTKVVENTYRDINIAYANELMRICREDDLNVYEIIRIANMHPRVNILQPGPGVGGHCISVDPWFLVGDYPGLATLIRHARMINDNMPEFVLERMHAIMERHGIRDVSRVGLYGLTYKENVDDTRESPTLQLLNNMKRHLAYGVKVYDPMVKSDMVANQYHDLDAFLRDVDMVVVMVGHDEIKQQSGKLSSKAVLDTRHVLHGKNVEYL